MAENKQVYASLHPSKGGYQAHFELTGDGLRESWAMKEEGWSALIDRASLSPFLASRKGFPSQGKPVAILLLGLIGMAGFMIMYQWGRVFPWVGLAFLALVLAAGWWKRRYLKPLSWTVIQSKSGRPLAWIPHPYCDVNEVRKFEQDYTEHLKDPNEDHPTLATLAIGSSNTGQVFELTRNVLHLKFTGRRNSGSKSCQVSELSPELTLYKGYQQSYRSIVLMWLVLVGMAASLYVVGMVVPAVVMGVLALVALKKVKTTLTIGTWTRIHTKDGQVFATLPHAYANEEERRRFETAFEECLRNQIP